MHKKLEELTQNKQEKLRPLNSLPAILHGLVKLRVITILCLSALVM